MDDNARNGLQADQWLPIFEKGEKRANTLGSGAFRFIRTRSSIRRELKRQCNRSKNGDNPMVQETGNSNSGGGLGKWLREHLGGGSKGQGQDASSPAKTNGNGFVGNSGNEKPCGRTVYASQNLYCSLPREHGRHHAYNAARKTGHGNSVKPQGYDRQRCASVNHHEKTTLSDLGTLTRGGPIYGSEGKTPKKRNRDRRRHSLNETHEQGRQRRRRLRIFHPPCPFDAFERPFARPFGAGNCEMTTEHQMGFAVNNVDEPEVDQPVVDLGTFDEMYEFEHWGEEEGEEEEESYEEQAEKRRLSGEDSTPWNAVSKWSDQSEAFHEEEEVGEAEELFSSTTSSTTEKLEEEMLEVEEAVEVEIPEEDSAEREFLIGRIKELQRELTEMQRKNRMLELWIFRHMKKTQERMIPSDPTKTVEQMEEIYREALQKYKMQVDEILIQQNELRFDFDNYVKRMYTIRQEERQTFNEFLNREKEVAIDLVFEKSGKRMTEKMMDGLTRRQTARREVLAKDRVKYVFLQHSLEDLKLRLKLAETLGEGMTTMDYEALHVANVGYKNRLDERDNELEKLRVKIAETVNGVAQYKEKEICIVEDIEHEQQSLDSYRETNANVREQVNSTRLALNQIRNTINEKKIEAGLLGAPHELIKMEKMMKLKNILKNNIYRLSCEVRRYTVAKHKLQKKIKKTQQS